VSRRRQFSENKAEAKISRMAEIAGDTMAICKAGGRIDVAR